MIIEIANDAIIKTWAKGKNIIGKSLFTVMPEIIEQGFAEILAMSIKQVSLFMLMKTSWHNSKGNCYNTTLLFIKRNAI
jgi:hypothetical protein